MKRTTSVACLVALAALTALPATAGAKMLGATGPITPGGGCTNCDHIQIASDPAGASYVVPTKGIITAFGSQIGPTVGAGDWIEYGLFNHVASNSYVATYESGELPIPTTAENQIHMFPVHVPVSGGEQLGIFVNTDSTTQTFEPTPANSNFVVGSFDAWPTVGVNTSLNAGTIVGDYQLNAVAHFELDADNDGYGDETEDCAPSNPAVHTGCVAPDTIAPVITQFRLAYKRFRYAPKGAVITKRAHPGSTLKFVLSEPSTVTFSVFKAFKGKITKGVCKKAGRSNRKNRRCTKLIFVKSFNRLGLTGANLVDFSGLYTDAKGATGKLHPGPYKIQAYGTDGSGNVGATVSADFTVVH